MLVSDTLEAVLIANKGLSEGSGTVARKKTRNFNIHVYVVVQFYPWLKLYLPLFQGMVMYYNKLKTKGNKI